MMRQLVKRFPLVVAFLAAAFATGCSSEGKLYGVSGTVKYNGEPVKDGRITFRMAGPNGRAYSTAIVDGNYKLKSEPGTATVEITGSRIVPGKFDRSNGTPEPVGEMYIPAKYNSATTLTKQVESGSNEIPFDLTK